MRRQVRQQNKLGMILVLAAVAAILGLKKAARKAEGGLLDQECGNQMHKLAFAGMMWMQQHETNRYPADFAQMFDILKKPTALMCPADTTRETVRAWKDYEVTRVSYVIVNRNLPFVETNKAFVRCPIHGHEVRGDGFVYDKEGKRLKRGVW